jgi:hypothetical protein
MKAKSKTKRMLALTLSVMLVFMVSATTVFADVTKSIVGEITESNSDFTGGGVEDPDQPPGDGTGGSNTYTDLRLKIINPDWTYVPVSVDDSALPVLTKTGTYDLTLVFDKDMNGVAPTAIDAIDSGDVVFAATWTGATNAWVNIAIPGAALTSLRVNGKIPEGMKIWAFVSEDKNNFGWSAPARTHVNNAPVISATNNGANITSVTMTEVAIEAFLRPGLSAADIEDGNITGDINIDLDDLMLSVDGTGKLIPGPYLIPVSVVDSNGYGTTYQLPVIVQSYSDNNGDGDLDDPEDKDFIYDPTANGILYARSFQIAYADSTAAAAGSNASLDEIIAEGHVAAWSSIDLTPVTIIRAYVTSYANYHKEVGVYKPLTLTVPNGAFTYTTPNVGSGSV